MKIRLTFVFLFILAFVPYAAADDYYGSFPVTVKGYDGDKADSTAYSGQIARHLLHNAIKKLAAQGNGEPNPELKAQMMAYFSGTDAGRSILSPASKEGFTIKQIGIDEISKGKELASKTYKGAVTGWPGNRTGAEVLEFMMDKAASANKGYDPLTGYDYAQLISKFMMGAVFYYQAADNYLDERLEASKNPNDKPYKEGRHYSGKEHVWDEAFGYFGAPAHAIELSADQTYGIAKSKPDLMAIADYDGDGMVDLYREMTYAHAYYAADADKGAKTDYLHGIVRAFLEGRKLIAKADSQMLSDSDRNQLKAYADTIKTQWEQVIAEAAFKYAGSVYKDLQKLIAIVESNGDAGPAFRDYAKHWGELKGFALALQTSGRDLGETSVRLNRLIGYGPVLLGGNQVSGVDADGSYTFSNSVSMDEYMVHMIKVQQLLGERFALAKRKNDVTQGLEELMESIGTSKSAEND